MFPAGPLHPRRHDLTKLKKLLLMDLAKLDTRIRRTSRTPAMLDNFVVWSLMYCANQTEQFVVKK